MIASFMDPPTSVDASSFQYRTYAWNHIAVELDQTTGILTITLNRPEQ